MIINLYDRLQEYFHNLRDDLVILIPTMRPLFSDQCDWLKFQIELMSNLYKFSNLLPSIGGDIATLWISIDGCYSLNSPPLKLSVSQARER